jgi:hypothetical protein
MKKQMKHFFVLLIAMHTVALCAQTREEPEHGFSLTIEEYHHELGPRFDRVTLRIKNNSNDVITEPGCAQWRGLYVLSVLYNGVVLEEKDVASRRASDAKVAQFCTHELGINRIKPGEYRDHWFDLAERYDVSRPGTYTITVYKEMDPKPDPSIPGMYLERAQGDPDRSETVKSNTLTVVVPEPPLKLTLSENDDSGAGLDRVDVTETNISDKDFIDQDHGCIRELGWFTVEVSYNGVPLVEKDVEARLRRGNETIELMNERNAPCATGPLEIVLKPGKSRKLWLGVSDIYDVTKPGSYEVYVSRETNPIGHINSEYVRSNTITIVVPKPEADEPK